MAYALLGDAGRSFLFLSVACIHLSLCGLRQVAVFIRCLTFCVSLAIQPPSLIHDNRDKLRKKVKKLTELPAGLSTLGIFSESAKKRFSSFQIFPGIVPALSLLHDVNILIFSERDFNAKWKPLKGDIFTLCQCSALASSPRINLDRRMTRFFYTIFSAIVLSLS